jgi:hypothetical protein
MSESRKMTRRSWLCLAGALAACGKKAEFPPDLFPETMSGGWRRAATGDSADARDPVPRNSVEQTRTARYTGPGEVEAHVYQLSSAAVGLDLAQRWRPSADTVFFNQGVYFVVVKWQSAERAALQEFVRALEAKLAPPAANSSRKR